MSTVTATWATVEILAAKLIEFLETNTPPEGLFAEDVFGDVSLPMWRLQADNVQDLCAIRTDGHPIPGRVPRHRLDATERGFVLEIEEEWTDAAGTPWYCRELFRADVGVDGLIHRLAIYCTGDWDADQIARHKATVKLIQP